MSDGKTLTEMLMKFWKNKTSCQFKKTDGSKVTIIGETLNPFGNFVSGKTPEGVEVEIYLDEMDGIPVAI